MQSNGGKPQVSGSTADRDLRINRKSWLLWGAMVAAVLGLTAAVSLLYMPIASTSDPGSAERFSPAYYSLVGLSGLVLVFCLFTALRHRELNTMRRLIAREEHETEDARTRLSELSALFQ